MNEELSTSASVETEEASLPPETRSVHEDQSQSLVRVTEAGLEVDEGRSEAAGEALFDRMEIADARLDIEGTSRYGAAWEKVKDWSLPAWQKAKEGFEWAKRPSTTYQDAIVKAAVFSAGTTVFLAPVFLARNCYQVYQSRHPYSGEEGGLMHA